DQTSDDDDEPHRELAIEPSAVDTSYEHDETKAVVRAAIQKLPEHYRLILTLFYLEELRYEEICEMTKLPMGTVKTQLYRARVMLQKILSRQLSREEVTL
ncbi:MAG: sigma-70 family RNA polymerase sigma factor, partial [Ignavibacteriales bacterium]|nr:sigma-70 family RNA polymerase sigma factor [Ignavibacteriales bacterium]